MSGTTRTTYSPTSKLTTRHQYGSNPNQDNQDNLTTKSRKIGRDGRHRGFGKLVVPLSWLSHRDDPASTWLFSRDNLANLGCPDGREVVPTAEAATWPPHSHTYQLALASCAQPQPEDKNMINVEPTPAPAPPPPPPEPAREYPQPEREERDTGLPPWLGGDS